VGLEWSLENGMVQPVPREAVLEVLTNPGFEIDESDALRSELRISHDQAAALVAEGVFEMVDIRRLSDAGLKRLAKEVEHDTELAQRVEEVRSTDEEESEE